MGRPKEIEPRDQQLNLSLTRAEYETVLARAKARGMRPGRYGRSALVGADSGVEHRSEPSPGVQAFILELKRLGNNLNQLVRQTHITGQVAPVGLEPLLEEIRRLLKRVFPP